MIRLKDLLNELDIVTEIEFDSQEELDDYKKKHKVRKGTVLKVRTTKQKIGRALHKGAEKWYNAMDKVAKTKVGSKVVKGVEKGMDWIEKQLDKIPE